MRTEAGELEVKFYLSKRKALEEKLASKGGRLVESRVYEVNLRFDTPDLSLLARGELLRLRQDNKARLTYKGAGSELGGARLRQELEITVSDFDITRELLEALGYKVYTMYEKYRTTYAWADVELAFDELPTGEFLEIEGPDGETIRSAAGQLGLAWDRRILDSYTVLFERSRSRLGFDFRDLSFKNFEGLVVTPEVLGVAYADQE